MDKNVLKKFAIESRQELMEKVANKINRYFVDEEFNVTQNGEVYVLVNNKHTLRLTKNEYENRQLLVKRIKEITLEQVIEEAAYTWFNRIIAIRYMEIHDYLPLTKDNQSLGVRVLSSKDNTPDPEIMKISNLINPDLDIEFNKEYYGTIQDNNKRFEYILLLVCKKLGKVIPQVFDGITDYIDILVPDNLLNESGYVAKLLRDVAIENFEQVEIIGWLYQYYNQKEKDRVMADSNPYKKNEIPYATQLFTPDWIVQYMVQNSLGRFWIEHSLESKSYKKWKYIIADNICQLDEKISPEEITFIDPCCGSGHILLYAFELLFEIYLQEGYDKKNISELILKKNLFGIDIDDRAWQLSVLSVLLKARDYDKNIFNKDIIKNINIVNIQESNNIETFDFNSMPKEIKEKINYLIRSFYDAKEYGSLIKIKNIDYSDVINYINNSEINIETNNIRQFIFPLIKIANILSNKYKIAVTNPPYAIKAKLDTKLYKFISEEYKGFSNDLFTAFIKRMENFLEKSESYYSMITPHSWMTLGDLQEVREHIIENYSIINMAHMGVGAFGADFGTTAFVISSNKVDNFKSVFIDLSTYKSAEEKNEKFETASKYELDQNIFLNLPNKAIAYTISKGMISSFSNELFGKYIVTREGMTTGNNDRFLRYWFEISKNKTSIFNDSGKKWYPYNKGGNYRKWYGNKEYVVNWENNGNEIMNFKDEKTGRIRSHNYNGEYVYKDGITWGAFSSIGASFRISNKNTLFDSKGSMAFANDNNRIYYYLAFLNSVVAKQFLQFLSGTRDTKPGHILNLPIILRADYFEKINTLTKNNIEISKEDWDSSETSWDFIVHPLIKYKTSNRIKETFEFWESHCNEKIRLLRQNEETLNKIFIDIYNLQDELNSNVDDKDITIRKADKIKEIKSLISYAVGCMFGRYSLNKEGLVYAGGKFESVFEKYKGQNLIDENGQTLSGNNGGWAGVSLAEYKYISNEGKEIELSYSPDIDNIIPLTEENYFGDDIVVRFKKFIEVVYGKETLYENLDFIAETLGKRNGENSEETIRRYFINDFYNDHVKMYQKRPIYWLFDSGKKNGFKCLIYMHRYNEGLVSKIRLDYLHRMQNTYEKELKEITDKLNNDVDLTSKRELSKRQADISAKLQETNEYDEKIAHIADQKIVIDLDDGVVVNYAKFSVKNPKTGKDESILAKIK